MLIEGLNRINAFKTSVIWERIQEHLICSFFFSGADSKLRFAIIIFPSDSAFWLTHSYRGSEGWGEGGTERRGDNCRYASLAWSLQAPNQGTPINTGIVHVHTHIPASICVSALTRNCTSSTQVDWQQSKTNLRSLLWNTNPAALGADLL